MEINKLRSIIKEAVKEVHLKEIEAVAENAAMEARLAEYDKAIKACEDKIVTAENLEEIQEFIDENKINEVRKRLKNLKKEKEKIEKAKAKKNNGKKVVTDEPTEEPAVEEGNYYNEAESDDAAHINALENDMEDDAGNNESLNESFLKMQKLAGVITESQYNQKIKLLNEAEEAIEIGKTYTASMPTSSDGKERIDVKVKILGKDKSNEDEFIVTPLEDTDYTNAASGQQNRFEKGKQYGVETKFIKLGVNELFGFGGPKTTFKAGDQVKEKDAPTEYWHVKQTNVDGNAKLYMLTAEKTRNPNRQDVRRSEMSLIKTS
jgi:hypothetical protein